MHDMLVDALYRKFVRPRWFRQSRNNPEIAHRKALEWLKALQQHPNMCRLLAFLNRVETRYTRTYAFGLWFPNPVGLAAGFDKYGEVSLALEAMGFGFIELGGFTPLAQIGNPEPRMVRDEARQELWNSMGFNNPGAIQARQNLEASPRGSIPRGINVGKGKDTPLDRADEDYKLVITELHGQGDYFKVNISSPNTPGLRDLQAGTRLKRVLSGAVQCSRDMARKYELEHPKPVLAKFALDVPDTVLLDAADICQEYGVAGMNLGNSHQEKLPDGRTGGRSGPVLYDRMFEACSMVSEHTNGSLPIIACGGIGNVEQAWKALTIPAVVLFQFYTALPFQGPGLPRRLARGLAPLMKAARKGNMMGVS